MTFKALDPDYQERVRESFARQGFMALIGASIKELAPGRCAIGLNVSELLGQQHGFVHAGVTTAIADTAAGYAAYSLFPAGSSVLTVEFKINLLAPADAEALVARADVIRSGKTITVVRADVFGSKRGEEKQIAAMQATMICLANTADQPKLGKAGNP